jgi:hypothetical protein
MTSTSAHQYLIWRGNSPISLRRAVQVSETSVDVIRKFHPDSQNCSGRQRTSTLAPGRLRRVRTLSHVNPSEHPDQNFSLTLLRARSLDTMATHILFESASGYAIFEVKQVEEIGSKTKEVQDSYADLHKFGKMVQLKSFAPFKSAGHALENANDVSEGESYSRWFNGEKS